MGEILLHENKKVSAVKEAHENGGSDFDENKLYQIDNMSLGGTKEKLEWRKREFNANLKYIWDWKLEWYGSYKL